MLETQSGVHAETEVIARLNRQRHAAGSVAPFQFEPPRFRATDQLPTLPEEVDRELRYDETRRSSSVANQMYTIESSVVISEDKIERISTREGSVKGGHNM